MSAILGMILKTLLSFFTGKARENKLIEAQTRAKALEAREESIRISYQIEAEIKEKQTLIETESPTDLPSFYAEWNQ